MKSLLLLRHAEAQDKLQGGSDFDRTLTDEGLNQASIQGFFLRNAGIAVDRIVASSAKRAGQTADVVKEAGGLAMEVQSVDALYNAPGDALLEYLRGLPEEASHVLMVAHLPGVAELVSLLTTEHVDLDNVFGPGTLAGVMVEGNSWRDFDYGTGVLTLFLPPVLRLNEG